MCLRKRRKNPQQGYDLKDESVPSADPSNVGSNFIRHLSGRVVFKKPSLRRLGNKKRFRNAKLHQN